jgi:hypothetical protein
MVEHLTHNLKVMGLNCATGNGKDKIAKKMFFSDSELKDQLFENVDPAVYSENETKT